MGQTEAPLTIRRSLASSPSLTDLRNDLQSGPMSPGTWPPTTPRGSKPAPFSRRHQTPPATTLADGQNAGSVNDQPLAPPRAACPTCKGMSNFLGPSRAALRTDLSTRHHVPGHADLLHRLAGAGVLSRRPHPPSAAHNWLFAHHFRVPAKPRSIFGWIFFSPAPG